MAWPGFQAIDLGVDFLCMAGLICLQPQPRGQAQFPQAQSLDVSSCVLNPRMPTPKNRGTLCWGADNKDPII